MDERVGLGSARTAALEVSLEVAADVEAQRQRLHQHWAKRLERAGYEVDRAARQYHAVEPETGWWLGPWSGNGKRP